MTDALQNTLRLIDIDAAVQLLRTLIRTRSTNPPAEEITLASWVHDRLQEYGMTSELRPFDGKRANVVARVEGTGARPGLIFSAHFDTVPEGDIPWDYPPYGADIHEGRIYGRGAADMKGGMAAMMIAGAAVARASVKLQGDLILAFTSGETSNCVGAQRLIAEGGLEGAGAFLVSEPTGLDVGIAEKAALWLRVTARGRTSHGSQPQAGSNAVRTLVGALARLEKLNFDVALHPLLGAPTLAIGKIHGGVNINVTPDLCVAELDVRILPGQHPDHVTSLIQEALGAAIEINRIDYKPAIETPRDHPFVKTCIAARAGVLGTAAPPVGLSYFTDGAVICKAMDLPMVILGPGGTEMTHQHNEYCEIDRLVQAAKIFTRIAFDYLGENAE
jgi:succinyl-diaminopimelate desuccinylase